MRVSVIIRRIEKIAYFPKLFQKIKINHFYFKVSIFIYLLQQKSFGIEIFIDTGNYFISPFAPQQTENSSFIGIDYSGCDYRA